jgi:hypothetical protein
MKEHLTTNFYLKEKTHSLSTAGSNHLLPLNETGEIRKCKLKHEASNQVEFHPLGAWRQRYMQSQMLAWVARQHSCVLMAAIFISDFVSVDARFPMIYVAATLYRPFGDHSAIIAIVILHAITDQRSYDSPCSSCCRASTATTDLITEETSSDSTYDCTTHAAFLPLLCLHVFCPAFLLRNIDLLGSFNDAQYSRRIFKFGRMADNRSTQAK